MIYSHDRGSGIGVHDNAVALAGFADALEESIRLVTTWTVAMPEIEAKIVLAEQLYDDAWACHRLRTRVDSLIGEPTTARSAVRDALVHRLAAASRATDTPLRLHAFYVGFKSELARMLREHASTTHEIWDAPTVRLCRETVARLEAHLDAARPVQDELGARFHDGPETAALDERWELLCSQTPEGAELVLDRPSEPARDSRFTVVDSAPFALVGDPESTATILHTMLMSIEIVTIEVCSRMVTDFGRQMPFEFVLDMARQCDDEARHAMLCCDRIRQLGFEVGDVPIDYQLWTVSYGLPLAERLAAHQRIGEQLGTDGAILNWRSACSADDPLTARIFEYITVDEMSHVGYGNKWVRRLSSDDAELRDTVTRAGDARRRFGVTVTGPPELPFNPWAAARSGFTPEEIEALARDREQRDRTHGLPDATASDR